METTLVGFPRLMGGMAFSRRVTTSSRIPRCVHSLLVSSRYLETSIAHRPTKTEAIVFRPNSRIVRTTDLLRCRRLLQSLSRPVHCVGSHGMLSIEGFMHVVHLKGILTFALMVGDLGDLARFRQQARSPVRCEQTVG